jgi:hypothetical protein
VIGQAFALHYRDLPRWFPPPATQQIANCTKSHHPLAKTVGSNRHTRETPKSLSESDIVVMRPPAELPAGQKWRETNAAKR